jgi:hypothetical protein
MRFQESVFDSYLDPELLFHSDEACFIFTKYVNNQHEICWSTDSPRAVHEAPLHSYDFKVGVWCTVAASYIIESFSL